MSTLYELAKEFKEAESALEDMDIPEDAVRDTLESLQMGISDKILAVAHYIMNEEAVLSAIDIAIRDMKKRALRKSKRVIWLREYLMINMKTSRINKIEYPSAVVSIEPNPHRVSVLDEKMIPEEFWEMKEPIRNLNKKAVMSAIKGGVEVPGCALEQTERVCLR